MVETKWLPPFYSRTQKVSQKLTIRKPDAYCIQVWLLNVQFWIKQEFDNRMTIC
jgi:hypothetical protein